MEGGVRLVMRRPTTLRSLTEEIEGAPPFSQVLQATILVGLILLTWLQWTTVFAGAGALLPILVSTLVSVALGLAVVNRVRHVALSLVGGCAVFLLGCAIWYNSSNTELLGDLTDSWKLLASTGLLAPTTQNFVIVPVAIAWFSGWVGAEIIGRVRPPLALALPLGAAHGITLMYTTSQRQPSLYETCALAVGLLTIAGLSNADRHPRHAAQAGKNPTNSTARIRRTQALLCLPLAVLLGLVGLGFERLISTSSSNPFDLRERLVRPLDVYETSSPLSQVKGGLIATEPTEVFAITVEGLASDEEVNQVQVATLDIYDGSLWSSSARFESAGAVLPSPDQRQALESRSLTQSVQIEPDFPFHFLPRIGQVTRTDSPQLGWDPRSGSIANVDPERDRYVFTTRVQRSSTLGEERSTIAKATVFEDVILSQPAEQLRYAAVLPDLSDEQRDTLQRVAAQVSNGAESEIEVLHNLQDYLASDAFAYNPSAPSGHNLAALLSYLEPDEDQPGIGSIEHSVASFALISRYLGIPSRIVVGYQLDEPVIWNTELRWVTDTQLYAWPQVWVGGYGWLTFDPTNTSNLTDQTTQRSPLAGDDATQEVDSGALPELQAPVLIPEPVEPSINGRRLATAAALLLAPALFVAGVVLAKMLKRRSRNQGPAADRISGAWLETREALEAYGLPSSESATVLELAEQLNRSGNMDVAVPVAKMANTVTKAFYAPQEPSHTEADEVWEQALLATTAAAAQVTTIQRLRAAANPRVLLRR